MKTILVVDDLPASRRLLVTFLGDDYHVIEAGDGHRFRLKPSVMYSRMPVDVYSVAHRAVRINDNVGAARTYANTYRSIQLSENRQTMRIASCVTSAPNKRHTVNGESMSRRRSRRRKRGTSFEMTGQVSIHPCCQIPETRRTS